jgi:division protein CdvB (Snf7/Vps24/ESCRT-III family)
MTDPRTLLKDAGYVAVGLGVIAFQRGQVRRRELEKQLAEAGPQIDRLAAAVEEARKLVEERVGALGDQLDRTVEEVETKLAQALEEVRTLLPEQALEAFDSAVGAAKDATGQLLDLVRPASAA